MKKACHAWATDKNLVRLKIMREELVGDETGAVGRGQIMKSILTHDEEFEFESK